MSFSKRGQDIMNVTLPLRGNMQTNSLLPISTQIPKVLILAYFQISLKIV